MSAGGSAENLDALRAQLRAATLRPEAGASSELIAELADAHGALAGARARAARWVEVARADQRSRPLVDRMLEKFPLDSAQGRALMSLAEALLRTPDARRADQLIAERLAAIRDAGVRGDTDLLLRTGFTLLSAAGRLLPEVSAELSGEVSATSLTKPVVAPIVRAALRQSMQTLGHAFIVGETIDAALKRARSEPDLALCSFDMLGEGARTDADAARYLEDYAHAIEALGRQPQGPVHARSGIPLDLSLDIIETLARDTATRDWPGLGLAVQAYGRRAPLVLDWIAQLARDTGRRMTVRLVKGAYWDSEIKRAQERGLASFPVYTSKAATDASYLEGVRRLFAARDVIYPQFATHNAYTVAAVLALAPADAVFEFQRLHGMGEALYAAAHAELPQLPPVRVYAPVGTHEELLPYLVRRLLENGANSSFVHQFMNPQIPVEQVVRDPIASLQSPATTTRVREPLALYGSERTNSAGEDFGDPATLAALATELAVHAGETYRGGPLLSGREVRDASI